MLKRALEGKKGIALLLIAALIAGMCTGCTGTMGKDDGETIEYHVQLETPPAPTDKLVIYQSPYYMAQLLDFAVPIFKAKFPDVEVEIRDFGTMNGSAEDEEILKNYKTTLQTELMAGSGPDLVLWNNEPGPFWGDHFDDIYKVMDGDAFYNLDNFLANDPDFDISEYNEAVLEGGMYRGIRQFIPLSYGVNNLITSEQALEEEGVTFSAHPTFDELCEQVTEYCEVNQDDPDKWSFDIPDKNQSLCAFLYPFNGLEVVDYEQKEVKIDSEAFRKTMELYKAIHPSVYVRTKGGHDYPSHIYPNLVRDRNVLLIGTPYVGIFVTTTTYGGLMSYEETPLIFGMPNVNGGKTAAYAKACAAIPKQAENKTNAYEFIKILLSDTIQSDYSMTYSAMGIPLRNESRKTKLQNEMQVNADRYGITKGLSATPLSDEQLEMIYQLNTDVTCVKNYSYALGNLVWEEMLPYFDGEKSYETCAKSLENKLKLYVAE